MTKIATCLIFIFSGAFASAAVLPGGIDDLQSLKGRLIAKISKLDHDIEQIVYRTQSHKVKVNITESARITDFTRKIEKLHGLKLELQARQKFIDQLIYAYSQHGPVTSPHKHLPVLLYKMAVRESQSQEPDFKLVEFMTHLSRALRDLTEPQENIFSFIESYMNYSTILEPKTPGSFAKNVRHYLGKTTTETVPKISVKKKQTKVQ